MSLRRGVVASRRRAAGATAITFVGAGAGISGTGDLTPALPGSLVAGDLMLAAAVERASTASTAAPATPSGWTKVLDVGDHGTTALAKVTMFARAYVAADADPLIDFTGSNGHLAQCAAFRAASTTVNVSGADYLNTANSVDIGPVGGVTPSVNGAVIVTAASKRNLLTSLAPGSGDTMIGSFDNGNTALMWSFIIQTTAAATGDKTFVDTGGLGGRQAGKMIAFGPA